MWDRIREAPGQYIALIGATWDFESLDGREWACMSVERPAEDLRNDSTWFELYNWLGEKLSLLYGNVAPKLREELDHVDAPSVAS